MKKVATCLVGFGLCIAVATQAHARDDKHLLPIENAMKVTTKEKLEGNVSFYFGSQKHPKVLTTISTDGVNRKTNAAGKEDAEACNWAFMSALIGLEKAAHSRGANAVVNIRSNYK